MVSYMTDMERVLILFGADSRLEWGRSFQIAKAFKTLGHDVVYVDIPLSVKRSVGAAIRGNNSSFPVYQPRFGLPCAKLPLLRGLNYQIISRQLVSYLDEVKFNPTVIWAYAPYEPKVTRLLRERYHVKLVVYDIADERISLAIAQHGEKAGLITQKYEEEIARFSDAVVTITDKLKETKCKLHKTIKVMPNGIDTEMFNNNVEYAKPEYLVNLPGKIVLYIGAIEDWVDIEAIKVAASACPDAQFVLVGPARIDISLLTQMSNVHIIGTRPYAEMPACIAHADVCILPFKNNEITQNSDPLKLLQYLSMGKPVVALYFQGINNFGNAVSVASDYREFAAMISLAGNATTEVADAVRHFDWKHLVASTMQQLKVSEGNHE